MTPLALYGLFRADVVDTSAPYLWSDVEVWSYMTDAESMFCQLTGGLQDSTSTLCELPITSGEKTAPYSQKIMNIRGAALRSTERDVKVLNYEDLSHADNSRQYTRQYMNTAGPVLAIVIGMDEGLIRLVQVPEADDTIDLVIDRLPLEALTTEAEFEVAEQHQRALMLWMKHLAYSKQNADTYDKTSAAEEMAKFTAYCALAKIAKSQRKHKPRLISYGGL